MEEEFKEVDLITLLRTFKREGISNFVVIRKEKFENNFIPKSKVKEKIEELKNLLKTCNKKTDIDRIKAINERILELQELLGEE